MKNLVQTIILICLSVMGLFGQGGTPEQDANREQVYRDSNDRAKNEDLRPVRPPSGIPRLNIQLSDEDKEKLKPLSEDILQYSQFLKQNKTGIFKIFPFLDCNLKLIDVIDENCLNTVQAIGNGSVYSFTKESNLLDSWAEIVLSKNSLGVPYRKNLLGVIKALGDISLDKVDINSPQISGIKNIIPPNSIKVLEETRKSLSVKEPAIVGNTYILRIMHFSEPNPLGNRRNDSTDLLLALKIIRKENNGSLTIIWKEIENKKTPKLSA